MKKTAANQATSLVLNLLGSTVALTAVIANGGMRQSKIIIGKLSADMARFVMIIRAMCAEVKALPNANLLS